MPEKTVSRRAVLGASVAAASAAVVLPEIAQANEVSANEPPAECLADLLKES